MGDWSSQMKPGALWPTQSPKRMVCKGPGTSVCLPGATPSRCSHIFSFPPTPAPPPRVKSLCWAKNSQENRNARKREIRKNQWADDRGRKGKWQHGSPLTSSNMSTHHVESRHAPFNTLLPALAGGQASLKPTSLMKESSKKVTQTPLKPGPESRFCTNCADKGTSLHFSRPQSSHLWNGWCRTSSISSSLTAPTLNHDRILVSRHLAQASPVTDWADDVYNLSTPHWGTR